MGERGWGVSWNGFVYVDSGRGIGGFRSVLENDVWIRFYMCWFLLAICPCTWYRQSRSSSLGVKSFFCFSSNFTGTSFILPALLSASSFSTSSLSSSVNTTTK